MALPNIAGFAHITKAAANSITCILQNQRLLLEVAAIQVQGTEMAAKIQKRIDTTDKEVASLKRYT